jgi:hypothetical protein
MEPNATFKLDPMSFHRFEPCQETNLVFFKGFFRLKFLKLGRAKGPR